MTNGTEIFYNVWSFQHGCWVGLINSPNSIASHCDYPRARRLLERWRDPGAEQWHQVREIDDNLQPGEVVGYSVWVKGGLEADRWTNVVGSRDQDNNPRPLTWEEAGRIMDLFVGSMWNAQIQEIGPDFQPCDVHRYTGEVKLAEVDPIEMPKPVAVSTVTAIDFDAYCGFKKVPPRSWTVERDPYTGMIKVK